MFLEKGFFRDFNRLGKGFELGMVASKFQYWLASTVHVGTDRLRKKNNLPRLVTRGMCPCSKRFSQLMSLSHTKTYNSKYEIPLAEE